jgi:hypothetical protein
MNSAVGIREALISRAKRDIPEKDRKLQRRLRLAGAVTLMAGLAAAALVYRSAVPDYDSAYVKMLNNTKKNEYEMEVVGGKANVFAAEVRDWFSSLWHGKNLAHTLAFLSVGGSFACFFVAHRLNYSPPLETPSKPKEL